MTQFLTPHEDIALDLIFDHMQEGRVNRTAEEYIDIARRLPPLKALHVAINQRLREFQRSGKPPFRAINHFRAGHTKIWEEPYPTSISIQTIRTALNKAGMRLQRRREKPIVR